jgi:hypothetical protein
LLHRIYQIKNENKTKLYNSKYCICVIRNGNYFTDIFGEDCGMRYCSLGRFCEQGEEYMEFFSDVKSVGDFKKKFPEY